MALRGLCCDVYGSIMVCYICYSLDSLRKKKGGGVCLLIYLFIAIVSWQELVNVLKCWSVLITF